MPPWKAEPGFGDFAGERRLTDAQIALIKDWAKAGAPEGDPSAKPQPPKFTDGWQGGAAGSSADHPGEIFAAGRWPRSVSLLRSSHRPGSRRVCRRHGVPPGNRRIVHHALVFLDASGKARELAAASPDGSYPCFGGPGFPAAGLIGGWAPGFTPPPHDPGLSQPLRKGTDVVIQIHYHPSGKPEQDQSSLGLSFSGPPTKGRTSILLFDHHLDIRAGRFALRRESVADFAARRATRGRNSARALSVQGHESDGDVARWIHQAADLDQGLGFQLAERLSLSHAASICRRERASIWNTPTTTRRTIRTTRRIRRCAFIGAKRPRTKWRWCS